MTLKIKRLLLVEISSLFETVFFLRYLNCLGETYSIDQAGL